MSEPKAATMQQRMGFVDADLKSATHDELMMLFTDLEWVDRLIKSVWQYDRPYHIKKIDIERIVEKEGDKNFRQTIGFIDAVIEIDSKIKLTPNTPEHAISKTFCVEVKSSSQVNAGELIRQIEVYRANGYRRRGKSFSEYEPGQFDTEVPSVGWIVLIPGEYPMRDLLYSKNIALVEYNPKTKEMSAFGRFK